VRTIFPIGDDFCHLIEHGEHVVRFALGVERDDVLHDVGVVPPVEGLQVVAGQDVDLALPVWQNE
jgi:hypothetical protein